MGQYSQAGAAIGGAGVTLLGGILAGNKAKAGYEAYINQLNKSIAARRDHRDKVIYEDPTQNVENQAAVTQTKDVLDAKTQTTHDRNIVTGGTEEAEALDKQAAAATVGNMMQQQAVAGQQRKDQVYSEDQAQIDAFRKYKGEALKAQKLTQAQAITNMANGSAQAQAEMAKLMPW